MAERTFDDQLWREFVQIGAAIRQRAIGEASAQGRNRNSSALHECIDREVRDNLRDDDIQRMSQSSGEVRRALCMSAISRHPATERLEIRRALLNRWRALYAPSLSVVRTAALVLRDVDRRRGDYPKTLEHPECDHLIDKIIACGGKLAITTIRNDLARK